MVENLSSNETKVEVIVDEVISKKTGRAMLMVLVTDGIKYNISLPTLLPLNISPQQISGHLIAFANEARFNSCYSKGMGYEEISSMFKEAASCVPGL
jgi:hypothetical protein